MNKITHLTDKQQSLIAISCLEAKGDIKNLIIAIDAGFDAGLTINEIKEALSQLYAYTGFPRSLNSLGALQQVISDREKAGKATELGEESEPLPKDYNALEQGTEIQTKLTGRPFHYSFAPRTDYYLKAHLFGDIFAGTALTHSQRELVTVSALCGLSSVEPQLKAHIMGAKNMGVTSTELSEIPAVLKERIGNTEAYRCEKALLEVEGKEIDVTALAKEYLIGIADSPYPIGNPNVAYAKYFVGNSYTAPMDTQNGGPVNVTFEPACRNNWHIHHNCIQVLICVAGRGWYQEWGKEPVQMTPGTVIAIPAEVKHWHGAAKNSWFQHLTYHNNLSDQTSNEWLEPVSDENYNKLK